MSSSIAPERRLQASLCEIETGLFSITYRNAVGQTLPLYQVGTDALDAQARVEAQALARGFKSVVWADGYWAGLLPPVHAAGGGESPCSVANALEIDS
jgi:hypothetical protein